ncbi:MAG: DNA translocase FtsK 4TM domain-containing protein [Bacteroidia bacterium]|nr:DNA translocase FtsK 4TM domain-containing protein [Bacteroidia bacterium]MDW8302225.1 DNA translocase FtsK 4TM domain-containing protein [Bacteroidia bacterium]
MTKKYRNTYIKPENKNANTPLNIENKPQDRPERNAVESKSPVLDFLNKYQIRMLIGILSTFVGGFLFVAFISHIYGTGKADQNIAQNAGLLRILGITPFREYAENWLGIMGAVLAYYFIREWFGYSSFLFALYCIYFGIKRLRIWTGFNVNLFKYVLFAAFWLSCFLSCVLYITTHQWFELGGGLGKALNTAIIRSVGNAGAIVLWLLILGIFLFFNVDFKLVMKTVFQFVKDTDKNTKQKTDETQTNRKDALSSNGINPRMKNTTSDVHNNVIIPPTTHKGYQKPSVMVLHSAILGENHVTQSEINSKVIKIIKVLESLSLKIVDVQYIIAPSITKFELYPEPSIPLSDILQKKADIQKLFLDENAIVQVSTSAKDAPIIIQIPNEKRAKINFNNVANTSSFLQSSQVLPIALGISEDNLPLVVDLAKHQHLLFIGNNSQVERNFHALIVSCLLSKTPQQIKFVFIDTQTTEFTQYTPIQWQFFAMLKNSDTPIANTSDKASQVLQSLLDEITHRITKLQSKHCKNIEEYNEKYDNIIPYLIVCIYNWTSIKDAKPETENLLHAILQDAHAAGIHIVISVEAKHCYLLPPHIKKYFSTILLHKTDALFSEQIIGQPYASLLLDDSDVLLCVANQMIRLECPKVYDSEITNINQNIKSQRSEELEEVYWLPEQSATFKENSTKTSSHDMDWTNVDFRIPDGLPLSLVVDAITLIVQAQNCEVSFIQKRLRLTEQRASRLLQYLEKIKVVSSPNSDGTRNVLIDNESSMKTVLDKLYAIA